MKPLACDFYELYNIPHTCRIANHLYNIQLEEFIEDDNGDTIYGYHSDAELVIKVAMKVKLERGDIISLTSEQIKNSFWHELFHAFNYYWNNETDEALAQTFANFMREFELTRK